MSCSLYGSLSTCFLLSLSLSLAPGLVYENTNPDLEKIFHLAIDKANEENEELNLHGVAVAIEPNNAFDTSKKLCKMLRVGVGERKQPSALSSSLSVRLTAAKPGRRLRTQLQSGSTSCTEHLRCQGAAFPGHALGFCRPIAHNQSASASGTAGRGTQGSGDSTGLGEFHHYLRVRRVSGDGQRAAAAVRHDGSQGNAASLRSRSQWELSECAATHTRCRGQLVRCGWLDGHAARVLQAGTAGGSADQRLSLRDRQPGLAYHGSGTVPARRLEYNRPETVVAGGRAGAGGGQGHVRERGALSERYAAAPYANPQSIHMCGFA